MSLLNDEQRAKLDQGLDLTGRLLGSLIPGVGGPVARGLIAALREVLKSGREPEEIIAQLRRLTTQGAARLDLDAEATSVADELKRELGEEDQKTITINGRKHTIGARFLTFENVVDLAGMSGAPTMVWRDRSANRAGTLSIGDSIPVVNELMFTVTHTGDA